MEITRGEWNKLERNACNKKAGKNLMKNTTLMMCLIAALAIFTLPVDAATTVSQSIPITLSVPVACAGVGEVVDLSGRLDTVVTLTRHNRRPVSLHVNAQAVAGTGEITGRTFQANGEINMPFQMFLLNGGGTISFKTEFLEVTSAPGPDGSVISFWLQGTAHVTFHANGTVTVKFNNFTVDCSGDGAGLWDY
jgi:hypothetical protein